MKMPSPTADYSVYESSRRYRATTAGAGAAVGGVHLASCMDRCMHECRVSGGESFECRPFCKMNCTSCF
jgi:hypothetical protein